MHRREHNLFSASRQHKPVLLTASSWFHQQVQCKFADLDVRKKKKKKVSSLTDASLKKKEKGDQGHKGNVSSNLNGSKD